MSAPMLADGIVRLRALEERDLAAYLQSFRNDPQLAALLGLDADPTVEHLRGRLGRPGIDPPELRAHEWIIAEAGSDKFAGSILLHSCDWKNRRAEVGYWIAPHARRRGLLAAALGLVLDWAFDEMGIERMEMTALPGNEAVVGIAGRFGFVYEGTMRARNLERGVRVDLLMWGLLAGERRARGSNAR
ncbi:MAG TPA: GNAT family protein [Gaiellaceae bacterium]|nr:GNAT family protein [Gaiellaceae bacterium]